MSKVEDELARYKAAWQDVNRYLQPWRSELPNGADLLERIAQKHGVTHEAWTRDDPVDEWLLGNDELPDDDE